MNESNETSQHHTHQFGFAGRIVRFFIDSKLTPLIVIAAVLLGAGAVVLLPREEEPQIVVPMIDLFVQMPGADAAEVQQRVAVPMEKLLWEIPGVEYIYSTSRPGAALVTVRFYVGQSEEEAIVRLNQKMYANFDRIPPGVSQPLVKPRRIDDVPILALTLHGRGYDHLDLRRIAAQLVDAIQQVPEVSETTVIGGRRREIRVELDAARLAAHHVDAVQIADALASANRRQLSGSFSSANREILVEAGGFLMDAADVARVVVGVFEKRPVYLRDVARIVDGAEEPVDYVLFGTGAAAADAEGVRGAGAAPQSGEVPAVTLAIAKRKGANAVWVADAVLRKVAGLRGALIPADVPITVTRNYGLTAEEKSNELLFHMAIAVVGVTILIALVLGWKESGVVAVAIPVTLALTLAIFYLLGFTLNRITLFALIFSIGILVDDPIVDVENIVRHFRLPENAGRPLLEVTVEAVNEVRSPLILATLTVIAAILPMAFVSGLMGPYMRPIPIGSSAAMLFSMFVAFVVTPWAAHRILRGVRRHPAGGGESEDWTTRAYRRVMRPLIEHPLWQALFLVSITLLLLLAMALVAVGGVRVKMLPFDNKSEFQIVIDMDEGTTLEQTARVTREIADAVRREPEVTDYQIYVGTAGPYNFNGLVRHYFLRRGPNVADIQVNLLGKHERSAQSHDIVKRVRPVVQAIAARHGARVKLAEVPPGPPVLQTLVAEVYGPEYPRQIEAARRVRDIFESTDGVVDVDWSVEADQPKLVFEVDSEKAALNGISAEHIAAVMRVAQEGLEVGLQHDPFEKEDVPIVLRHPVAQRSAVNHLLALPVASADGSIVPLGELVTVEERISDVSLYRKNLMPVVYVTGDVAGAAESPVYAILKMNRALAPLDMEVLSTHQPFSTEKLAMKWDGEWHITYEVFRDLGAAFAVVLVLIYVLVVGWFRSFETPFIIMAAIPFSLVGILPAHWALGAFFTATSMIGFIAGAGIVVRNSIILVDFIELRLAEGMPLAEAVVDAGAVRFRPMMLTAAAVVVGASVILFDPIFQGLAISLMAGEVASLFLSRMAVPILYDIAARRREGAAPRA
ncbi:MAG: efflux RND transporter permease subunit [Myxococcales bacterium]|nr:efflux RND transporter permease subunit [Myxococcales bacterium]